jgi:hypothetical protein
MGALTEPEIFDCLRTNFRLAANLCVELATKPRKGPNYNKLREALRLIEGAARQAGYWRSDARWLQIGLDAAEAHNRAGEWLRGVKQPDGSRRAIPPGEKHPLFMRLAEVLRAGLERAEQYRTNKTGRIGTILPKPLPGPHRDTRPVSFNGFKVSKGGVLIPAGAA